MTSIYVIGTIDGPKKIGMSSQPTARLSAMRTANPLPISILFEKESGSIRDAAAIERIAHGRINWKRLAGEWFDVSLEEAIAAIEEITAPFEGESPMNVAEALRKSRIAAGLTQKQVAEMLGITPQFVSDIEQDRRALGEKYLLMLPEIVRAVVARAMMDQHQAAISRIGDALWESIP